MTFDTGLTSTRPCTEAVSPPRPVSTPVSERLIHVDPTIASRASTKESRRLPATVIRRCRTARSSASVMAPPRSIPDGSRRGTRYRRNAVPVSSRSRTMKGEEPSRRTTNRRYRSRVSRLPSSSRSSESRIPLPRVQLALGSPRRYTRNDSARQRSAQTPLSSVAGPHTSPRSG
ncbi:MAG: hypothetical protein F4Y21_07080 [Gemmatimonadetes bacterium]|nr:hypothetical protein [Gemmatimonadota bacterium]